MNRIPDPFYIKQHLFNIRSGSEFKQLALSAFLFQYQKNPVYRQYCELLDTTPADVKDINDIPFLPIEFFKRHKVLAGEDSWEKVFVSSGTTGMQPGSHYVKSLDLYRRSFLTTFSRFYGQIDDYCILALLPDYSEQEHSSLVFMARELINQTGHPDSRFYLHDYSALADKLSSLESRNQQVLLLGVSFALLELVEKYNFKLNNTIVMETGGMKGRREEITREELHRLLKEGFGVDRIHSEYGMAELLSQAYSRESGIFNAPPWMKILVRDLYDPFQFVKHGRSGGINVIDLANIYSCPFIETKDVGKLNNNNSFEVLGRFDYSDIRGCNLMVME